MTSEINAALLTAIDNGESTRDDIAFLYAQKITSRDKTDISTINERISQRWSPKVLERIKKQALKQVFGKDAFA
jgi:oligoribonuclease (3'-5' exoribonuclease)